MTIKKYMGMSLTERLKKAGALTAFSGALQEKDKAKAISLLINVEYTPAQASDTVKNLYLDPNSYRNFS